MVVSPTMPGAARDAARREHALATHETELAELERKASDAATTPWSRSAHRLAAEVHASSAATHARTAVLYERTADVVEACDP
jgi:hypothetical protein